MRETKFHRLTALCLCLATLLGSTTVFVSAAGAATGGGSVIDSSLEEINELLNANSYEEYSMKHKDVPAASGNIAVDIFDYVTDYGTANVDDLAEDRQVKVTEQHDFRGVYTPQDGSVTWKVTIPTTAKYAIRIEYWPDNHRSTSIERVFQVNGKVPFSEARYLTLAKNWTNGYSDAVIVPGKNESAESIKALAEEHGYSDVTIEDGRVVIPYASNNVITNAMTEFASEYSVRFFLNDINKNEIRPVASEDPTLMTYYLKDSTGYYGSDFEFVFEAGENTITLEGKNEPMTIKSITLCPLDKVDTYEEYAEKYKDIRPGTDVIKLEAELPSAMSNKTIYPVEDRSCAINSPASNKYVVLNTIGGEKWATAGQWVEYRFSVENAGMYDVVSRFRQNVLDGMYTCRSFYIYSEGLDEGADGYYNGTPFEEARKLVYDYSDEWQVTRLSAGIKYDSNGDGKITQKDKDITYPVYFAAGTTYTIRFEVTLGKMGDIVRDIKDILNQVNNDYLEIIKLTGTTPDQYRDYGFSSIMLPTLKDMVLQSRRLTAIAKDLEEIAGEKSSNYGTLIKIAKLLEEMGTDEDEIAKNLSQLKSHIGTLGTFLSDVQTQPLQLDYIIIQPAESKLPKAKPNFFQSFAHEVEGFFQSFFRDYDSLGKIEETGDDATEVWLATGRDQSQVIRNLVNNEFTLETNISVDLKLVAAGTLLPSILAGSGPDVYLGLAHSEVINYAIRSALINIEEFDGFDEFTEANFNEAAMQVLGMEDADENMHYYGLPENQSFPMMFVRIDILADLGLDVPQTWDDLEACVPVLQANNMQIGLSTDYNIFLYQSGGNLFADGGMRINLGSPLGGASFEKMCNFFTMYSYPYKYDAANRFRTGEMPIVIGDYTGVYNQLKVFATEIEGMWRFYPLPGTIDENGDINNASVSAVSAVVMVKGCEAGKDQENAWEFMKWYTGEDCQEGFANEMVAILGPSAKQNTANKLALQSLPWTTEELTQVLYQFQTLASVPNYPGAYIISRYTTFAFLDAFNNKADPVDALNSHLATIDKEIARKRDEFNLETLTEGDVDYKDLTTKRMAQIEKLVGYIKENSEYSDEYDALMESILAAIKSDDSAYIHAALEAVLELYNELDPDGSKFKADRTKVMGYDMEDKSLTKQQKKKLRNCFSYEVYANTDNIVTQFKCCADFLEDVVTYMNQK